MSQEKTNHQILRFIQKLSEKFPQTSEPEVFTDVHIRVSQETGDVMAYDDEDNEITRVVVEEWINPSKETERFYSDVAGALRPVIQQQESEARSRMVDTPLLGIIEPYNYVLENESGEHITELYVVDDEQTVIVGTSFMSDLSKELDDFIDDLLKKE